MARRDTLDSDAEMTRWRRRPTHIELDTTALNLEEVIAEVRRALWKKRDRGTRRHRLDRR